MICAIPSRHCKGNEVPAKTNTDVLRELSTGHATLTERVDNVRRAVDKAEIANLARTELLANFSERLTKLEERISNQLKVVEEGGRTWWSLWPALLGALVGSFLTFLANLWLTNLRQ